MQKYTINVRFSDAYYDYKVSISQILCFVNIIYNYFVLRAHFLSLFTLQFRTLPPATDSHLSANRSNAGKSLMLTTTNHAQESLCAGS